jgi:CBS domain-containing protein
MKVQEFMIKDVISVHETANVKEVMEKMVIHKIGGMPIVNSDGKLVGMVSDGDILRNIQPKDGVVRDYGYIGFMYEGESVEKVLSYAKDLNVMKVAKKRGLVAVKENDEMEKVVKLLAKHHFKKIPVVNVDFQVVGVISRGDVIRNIQNDILNKM